MGYWNETCGISNLPIKRGDRIVMFLLVSPSHMPISTGMALDPTTYRMPMYFAIRGTYNDYGGIEGVEDADELFEYLNKLKILKGNEAVAFGSAEDLCETFCKDHYVGEDKKLLTPMLIREEIYETLVDAVSARSVYGKDESLREVWALLLEDAKEKYYANPKRDEPGGFISVAYSLCYKLCSEETFGLVEELLLNMANEKLKKQFLDLVMFDYALTYTRKGWYCNSGVGSQAEELVLPKVLAKKILEIIEREIVKSVEEGGNGGLELIHCHWRWR